MIEGAPVLRNLKSDVTRLFLGPRIHCQDLIKIFDTDLCRQTCELRGTMVEEEEEFLLESTNPRNLWLLSTAQALHLNR